MSATLSVGLSSSNSMHKEFCLHFSAPPGTKDLRNGDNSWYATTVARFERALRVEMAGEPESWGYTIKPRHLALSSIPGVEPIGSGHGAIAPSPSRICEEYIVCMRPDGYSRAYGPTSFTGWASQWEHIQFDIWLAQIAIAPQPTFLLTARGHHLDSHNVMPGLRIGTDVRAYQQSTPIVHRLAVLGIVGRKEEWYYALVFVYGEEHWGEFGVSEKVGILRVREEMLGPSLVDAKYDDEVGLAMDKIEWSHLREGDEIEVMIALPSSHPRPAFEIDLYDAPSDRSIVYRTLRVVSDTVFLLERSFIGQIVAITFICAHPRL